MKELIARLEQASEGGAELDEAIFAAIGREHEFHWNTAPRYTTSLDAALTLVPEGWRTQLYQRDGGWFSRLVEITTSRVVAPFESDEKGFAPVPTPALALCIAALKARITEEGRG